jgi:hypothetical protein
MLLYYFYTIHSFTTAPVPHHQKFFPSREPKIVAQVGKFVGMNRCDYVAQGCTVIYSRRKAPGRNIAQTGHHATAAVVTRIGVVWMKMIAGAAIAA